MSEKDDGGPAFPVVPTMEGAGQWGYAYPGMTLRDWFAGQVEVEIDISIDLAEQIAGRTCPPWQSDYIGNIRFWAEVEAIVRGIKADAMLAERAKA